jgi:hypothetical protein
MMMHGLAKVKINTLFIKSCLRLCANFPERFNMNTEGRKAELLIQLIKSKC